MQTSGAASEGGMVLAVVLIALGVAVVLLGGPRETLVVIESTLRASADVIMSIVQQFR